MPGSALCCVVAVATALAAQASLAAPETLSLGHASVTFNRGGFLPGSEPGAFGAFWAIPDLAGWGLTPDQYRVQATGIRLQIDFLPDFSSIVPEETTLRVWGVAALASSGRFSDIFEANAGMALPLTFEPAAGYAVTAYHVTLEGDYRASPADLNGVFELTGSLGVNLQDGSRVDLASFDLKDRSGAIRPMTFEADVPATADFRTLAGAFQTHFLLDPQPADWPIFTLWAPFGVGGSEFLFRSLAIDVLTAPVPEPGSTTMLLTGLAGLAAWQRRRLWRSGRA